MNHRSHILCMAVSLCLSIVAGSAAAMDPRVLILILDRDGGIQIAGHTLTIDDLQPVFARVIESNGYTTEVQIRPDPTCPYSAVARVLNACLDAKLLNVCLTGKNGERPIRFRSDNERGETSTEAQTSIPKVRPPAPDGRP